MASHGKEPADTLPRKFVDALKGTAAVWCAGIVAKIQIIVSGHQTHDFPKHGKAAITGIKNADGAGKGGKVIAERGHRSSAVLLAARARQAVWAAAQEQALSQEER